MFFLLGVRLFSLFLRHFLHFPRSDQPTSLCDMPFGPSLLQRSHLFSHTETPVFGLLAHPFLPGRKPFFHSQNGTLLTLVLHRYSFRSVFPCQTLTREPFVWNFSQTQKHKKASGSRAHLSMDFVLPLLYQRAAVRSGLSSARTLPFSIEFLSFPTHPFRFRNCLFPSLYPTVSLPRFAFQRREAPYHFQRVSPFLLFS